eukprot:9553-Heterococcus_DN1.PRE.5
MQQQHCVRVLAAVAHAGSLSFMLQRKALVATAAVVSDSSSSSGTSTCAHMIINVAELSSDV